MLVKTLVALATEKMLLKTSGKTFLRGIDFMYAAGLAPERLSVMMTQSGKYVLQFHSKCDIRPFAANYPSFSRVLRGIVHVRAWRIKSLEFVNVAFDMKDVDNLERAIDKLGVELVLLRNCTYPGVRRGDEAIRFLNALNRKKQAVVCEYGDDRLKHRISRRNRPTPSNRVPFPARARLDAEDAVDNQPVDEEWDQNEAMEGPDEPENVGGRDVMDVDDMADGGGAEGRQNDRVDAVIRRLRDVAEGGAGLQRRIAQRRVAGGGIDRRADRSHQQQRRLMLAAVDVLMGGAGGGRPAQEDARLYPRRRSGRLAAQAAAAAVGVVQPPVAPDIEMREELRVPAQGAEAAGLAPIGGRDGDIPERFLEAFREHEEILRRAFQLQEQLLQAAPPLLGRLEELQFGGARHGIPPRHAPDEPEVAGAEDVRDAEEEAVEEEEEDVDGL